MEGEIPYNKHGINTKITRKGIILINRVKLYKEKHNLLLQQGYFLCIQDENTIMNKVIYLLLMYNNN